MSDNVLRIIIISAAIFFGTAFALYIAGRKKSSSVLWVLGEVSSGILVINNFVTNGYVPFVSMYQLLTAAALLFGFVYLYIAKLRDGSWTAPYFIACSMTVCLGLCFMDINAVWHFPPALRSVWFLPHVFVYVISYIMGAAAFSMTAAKLFTKDESVLNRLDDGIYDCVCVLFPFMTMGMLFGAVWANEVWGAFWAWDIKECWSLVTWSAYMLWLHVRRSKLLRKYRDLFTILGFVFILITFFFVNNMNTDSLHTYN